MTFVLPFIISYASYRVHNKILIKKYDKKWYPLIYLAMGILMIMFGMIEYPTSYIVFKFLGILLYVLFPVFFYEDRLPKKLCCVFITFLTYILSEAIVMLVMSIVMKRVSVTDEALMQQIGFSISAIVYLLIVRMITHSVYVKREITELYRPEFITVLVVNLIFDSGIAAFFRAGDFYISTQNVMLILFVAIVMMTIMTFYTVHRVAKSSREVMEMNLKMQQIDMENKFAENIKDTIAELRNLRHDMNNNLGIIQGLLSIKEYTEASNYLDSLMNDLKVANTYVFSDNKFLDALINTKINRARSLNIPIDIQLHIGNFPMADKDLCALMANILENAIDGAKETKNAQVNLLVEKKDCNLHIVCENTYSVQPIIKNGRFITTKSDKKYHGIGTQIIRSIVEKYNGKIDFTVREMFLVDISIPLVV